MAVVTKEDEGTDSRSRSAWDDIGWYTSDENADATFGPVITHEFKYRHSTDGETWVDYIEVTMLDTTVKGSASADVTELPVSDTYSFQVVTVKTTVLTGRK